MLEDEIRGTMRSIFGCVFELLRHSINVRFSGLKIDQNGAIFDAKMDPGMRPGNGPRGVRQESRARACVHTGVTISHFCARACAVSEIVHFCVTFVHTVSGVIFVHFS